MVWMGVWFRSFQWSFKYSAKKMMGDMTAVVVMAVIRFGISNVSVSTRVDEIHSYVTLIKHYDTCIYICVCVGMVMTVRRLMKFGFLSL